MGFTAGCSSFLYFPDHQNYLPSPPEKLKVFRQKFTAAPGISLDLWEARSGFERPTACLLLVHGNGQNASAHIQNVLWMTEHGFRVFSFDYRGYGDSPEKPDPENTVHDTIAAIKTLSERCVGLPLVALGQSLGGAVLLRALADYGGKPPLQSVLIESSFLSYRHISVDVLSRFWPLWPFQWLGWLVMSDTWAPARAMDRLPDLPYLILHGTKDTIVPYRFGVDLYEKLPIPRKQFIQIPQGRHTEAFFLSRGKYRPQILHWLREQQEHKKKPRLNKAS